MLIGILSDTHDRAGITRAALDLLIAAQAQFFIHCGDVGGSGVIDHFAGLPMAFVWGNNDWDRIALERHARALGVDCYGNFADLNKHGKRIAVVHGDDDVRLQSLIASRQYQYVMHGHTHVRRDERVGGTRIINPGALHRAREKTVALLNLVDESLRFVPVPIADKG